MDLSAPIQPRPSGCVVPLTAEQRRLFGILKSQDPAQRPLSARMCASATRVSGPLDAGLLQASIEAVVRRHESLRTRFATADGVTTQHIDAPDGYELNTVDLSTVPQIEAEREAKRLAQDFQDQKIDLSVGRVFEARLFKLSVHEHVLILLVDHMVSDGISNAILGKEIWRGYDDAVRSEPTCLPPLPVQFADYAVWQERTHESWKRHHESYWRRHLATASRTNLPGSSEIPCAPPPTGVTLHLPFGAALSKRLHEVAERERTRPSIVALAIYAVAMSHWCGREDLLVRCPSHGRHGRPELENVIGFIANRLYLRINVSGQETLRDLLSQVHREMDCAFQHQDFDRIPDFMPECLTELAFHWRSARWPGRSSNPRPGTNRPLRMQPFLIRLPAWPWKFWSVFDDTPAGMCATVHYWPHLIAASAVQQFGSNIRAVAEALVERPLARVNSTGTPATGFADPRIIVNETH